VARETAGNIGGTRVADEPRMITRFAFIASLGLVGCVSAQPLRQTAQAPQQTPKQEDRHVYRVDFVVAATDPGKPVQTSTYTLNLEEYENGQLRLGSNVQLTPQSRQDVGLKISASLRPRGDDLLLRDEIEMSGLDDPGTIHKITTEGDALLRTGQQTLVASLEDPLSHKRYQVSASATRLR
jgi:hypothetical protein